MNTRIYKVTSTETGVSGYYEATSQAHAIRRATNGLFEAKLADAIEMAKAIQAGAARLETLEQEKSE